MKKKIVALCLMFSLIMVLSGCGGMKTGIIIDDQGNVTIEAVMDMDKDFIDEMQKQAGQDSKQLLNENVKLVTVDGVEYYRMIERETVKLEELQKEFGGKLTQDSFVILSYTSKQSFEEIKKELTKMLEEEGKTGYDMDAIKYRYYVTFPDNITHTNGYLTKNKKTAVWDINSIKSARIYAFTENFEDTQSPSVYGVKNHTVYTEPVTIKYRDNSVIASARMDGKWLRSGSKVTEKGRHTLILKDIYGNTTTTIFRIK